MRFTGPLTGEALLYFKTEIVARHGPCIRAFVADYRAAIIALDGDDLDAVLEGEPGGAAPSMPAAMIARQDDAQVFGGHAARMALLCIRRRVFVEFDPAISWALTQAHRQQA